MAAPVDIAIISLGTTMGWRRADEVLAAQIEAAGASCAIHPMRLGPVTQRMQRTIAVADAIQAAASRRAAGHVNARAVIYSSITAALAQPVRRPHAIRFDTIAALNRHGIGGAWQRRRERVVLGRADLLLPWSEAAAAAAREAATPAAPDTIVLPCVVEAADAVAPDAPAATAYAGNPDKRGLDTLCRAWARAAREGDRLVVGGIGRADAVAWLAERGIAEPEGIQFAGPLPSDRWRQLVAGSRIYVNAARYEDWGIAQMEALASGTPLVTLPTPGPNVALPFARQLAPQLVASGTGPDALATAISAGLATDETFRNDYAAVARRLLEPFSEQAIAGLVAERVVPALLGGQRAKSRS